jgi:hypothetical protein
MRWIKKIAAAVLMLLAAIGLLVCVAGFIGVLAINAPLSNVVVETVGTIDGFFSSVDQTAGRIQDGLTLLVGDVRQIQDLMNTSDISDETVLRSTMNQIAEDEIKPAVVTLTSTTGVISDGVAAFTSVVAAINQIPGVNLPTVSEELTTVDSRLGAFQTDLEAFQTQLSTSQDIKTRLLQPVNRLVEGLNQAEAKLVEGRSKIAALRTSLSSLQVRILGLIDLTSLLLASLSVLLGAGQILLIRQSWIWFKSIPVSRPVNLPEAGVEEFKAPAEDVTPSEYR